MNRWVSWNKIVINDGIVEIGAVENRPNWDHDGTEQMRANNQNEMNPKWIESNGIEQKKNPKLIYQ